MNSESLAQKWASLNSDSVPLVPVFHREYLVGSLLLLSTFKRLYTNCANQCLGVCAFQLWTNFMATSALEWSVRTNYVLTELVLFTLNIAVLLTIACLSAAVVLTHTKKGRSFFTTLRPLLELTLSSAIGFVPAKEFPGEDKIDVVFVGFRESSSGDVGGCIAEGRGRKKWNLVRIWIRVYFVVLCGLIVMWMISVFSYSLLYEKSSSCSDISMDDTDLTCFQLSHFREAPDEIQQIIDEEEGELVPCRRIQDFLITNNITYDLEVICYHYHLNILAALGISYGTLKTISFVITVILTVILMVTNKCCNSKKGKTWCVCYRKSSLRTIVLCQLCLTLSSLLAVAVFGVVIGLLHQLPGTRNTTFDYLRGETFNRYTSVVFFVPFTLVYTVGLFPWWAFKPLEDPPCWDTANLSKEEISKRLNYTMHYIVLHERFSTGYIFKAEHRPSNVKDPTEHSGHDNEGEESVSAVVRNEAETAV